MDDVCAWCGSPDGGVEVGMPGERGFLSGLCRKCADNLRFQHGASLQAYIDTIDIPVIVVDREVVVQMANAKARSVLVSRLGDLKGQTGGMVFECSHARKGGCGRTVHCTGCTIRRSVERTWETGEALREVPTDMVCESGDGTRDAAMKITTVRADNVVMLRVDSGG